MAAQDPVIAIDTNVVVRFLVNDDREQARRARALIDGEEVFVATIVWRSGKALSGQLS
jgi:hypothetical protein